NRLHAGAQSEVGADGEERDAEDGVEQAAGDVADHNGAGDGPRQCTKSEEQPHGVVDAALPRIRDRPGNRVRGHDEQRHRRDGLRLTVGKEQQEDRDEDEAAARAHDGAEGAYSGAKSDQLDVDKFQGYLPGSWPCGLRPGYRDCPRIRPYAEGWSGRGGGPRLRRGGRAGGRAAVRPCQRATSGWFPCRGTARTASAAAAWSASAGRG